MTGSRKRDTPRHPLVRVAIWLVPLVLAALLVVGGLVLFGGLGPTPLEKAADTCSVGKNTVKTADDGTSLTVAVGKKRTGWQATIMSVCVLTELEAPTSVKVKIERAPEATEPESDSWDDYVVTWTYQRDGLEITVEMGKGAVDDFQRA